MVAIIMSGEKSFGSIGEDALSESRTSDKSFMIHKRNLWYETSFKWTATVC